jgi:hypothetical protein
MAEILDTVILMRGFALKKARKPELSTGKTCGFAFVYILFTTLT